MDVRSLRYFIAVYEGGSISAAARRCHVAQPSISAALLQLETRLSTPLFERHRRGVTPTAAGERLYPMALRVCDDLQAIDRHFQAPGRTTPVRLGLMRSLGARRMTELLKEYLNRADALDLTLVNPEEPCEARLINQRDVTRDEAFQPVWHDRYRVALPSRHPLAQQRRLRLADLDGLPIIWRHPCAAMEQLGAALAAAGLHCPVRARLRTIEYTLGLVAAGVGASLVPCWPEITARRDVVCRPLAELAIEQVVGIAYLPQRATQALAPLLALGREAWQAQRPAD